jgi:heavy metal sensor kinase
MTQDFPPRPAASGGTWWLRRSLRLRLAMWFALIAFVLLLSLLPPIYSSIGRRLTADLDRQLEIDWVLIEAHLEPDGTGGVRWRKESPSSLESGGYAESWFDVWADGHRLMSHWPEHGMRVEVAPLAPGPGLPHHDLVLPGDRRARALQRPARLGETGVILRLFRDKSSVQATLREILLSLGLGVPLAVLLAAAGGYFMAGRTLRPVVEMTEQARQIHSESLGRRLPNPNPHDELGQLATVFNETLQRLENSFEALRRFTADASHELRTPLTALRSVGEIALREGGDAESLRETIGSMLEEAQRLHDLADTLLNLARVESGRIPLRPEPLRLDEIAAEVCERLEVLAAEKRQHLELRTLPGLIVAADRVLLRQAVMNLLHNAIRHSPPQSTVRVTCRQEGPHAILEVADEGPGIGPEHREKIFDRFYRIDKARSRSEGGAGLGLALAKLSVERFGGHIELESAPGQGSRFAIRLPRLEPDHLPLPAQT